jgi:fructan beta-fructosidase
MKTNIYVLITIFIISFLTACNPDRILIEDFEFDDEYFNSPHGQWIVEGTAFGSKPSQQPLPNQAPITGFLGKGYANSYHGGDDTVGSLLSYEFDISRNYINFLIGGGSHSETYIELLINDSSIYKTTPLYSKEELNWMSWNVEKFIGCKARIRIVDEQIGGWGHILVDEIEMNNKPKNTYQGKMSYSLKARKKYLLLPIQDGGREYNLSIKDNNGINILEPINISLAEKTDYWVPVNIEAYKNKVLTLEFNYVIDNLVGVKKIKQSNTFKFRHNEPTRPLFHFTAPYGWINDPNGLFWKDGIYHMYYQYNPYGTRWGNMHWGHAISKDLIKWEHKPIALFPDTVGAAFSGSAVIDKNNTAEFGTDAVIAVYTSFIQTPLKGYQRQSIAYSSDDGFTFYKYDKNPVLKDDSYQDFRDPRVMWHEPTTSWIMTLATGQFATFYSSKNLKTWEKVGTFGENIDSHTGIWECPDLFPLEYEGKQKWVLVTSITSGQQNADCSTQYFIGDFDGESFIADDLPYPLWIDYGCDNYAGITWNYAPDNRRIFIGWMGNHYYAFATPSVNFRNAMTIPRELKLVNNGSYPVLASYPVKELDKYRSLVHHSQDYLIRDSLLIRNFSQKNLGVYDIELEVTPQDNNPFCLSLSNNKNESLSFTFNPQTETIITNRASSGSVDFHPKYKVDSIISPLPKTKTFAIRLLIDKSSSELFVNDGVVVQSNVMFPTTSFNNIKLSSGKNPVHLSNLDIYEISSLVKE